MPVRTRIQSVILAFRTFPNAREWLRCGALYAAFVAVASLLGGGTGFLKFERMSGAPLNFIVVALLIFIRPALIEEAVFRGLFLPHPREGAPRKRLIAACVVSLAIFVTMHPLNGIFVRHEAFAVFTHPLFLLLAGLLGLVCTIAYQITGSLWPPVLMHWLTVLIWTMFLGGKRLLTGGE